MVSAILVIGYLAVLTISALLGFAAVEFFYPKKETEGEEESDAKGISTIVESIKSGAVLVKMAFLAVVVSIADLVKGPEEPETVTEYDNMADVEKPTGPESANC